MVRYRISLVAGCAVMIAACADSPVQPTAPGVPASAPSEARPGANVPHQLGFTGSMFGNGTVLGSITGSYGAANLKAAASGSYTLSISTVDPGNPTFCTPDDLNTVSQALGGNGNLVDAKSGNVSVSISQSSGDGRASLVWELSGMAGADGRTWSTGGNSTVNFPAFLDPSSDTASLTITQNNGVIGFNRFVSGTKKKDFSTGCRVTFTLTLVRQ